MPTNGNRNMGSAASPDSTSQNTWWTRFPGFTPNFAAGVSKEFARLAKLMGWKGEEFQERKAEAYESEFNFHFANGRTRLETWQALCVEVGVEVGVSITQCKKNLKGVLVNIINLLNHRRNRAVKLIKFATFREFRAYTMKRGNTVNLERAKQDGFLKIFLRELSPRHGGGGGGVSVIHSNGTGLGSLRGGYMPHYALGVYGVVRNTGYDVDDMTEV